MRPNIIGHRGNSSERPENTLSAFTSCVHMGIQYIEMDVRLSKDCIPVVFHDKSLYRTTNRRSFKALSNCLLEEIKTLDAGSWFSKEFQGESIPLLEDVLSMDRGQVGLMVELKAENSNDKELATIVASLLKGQTNLVVGSFSYTAVKELKKQLPHIPVISIVNSKKQLARHLTLQPQYLALDKKMVHKELVDEAHSKGIKVWVWTVDTEQESQKLQEFGVDGIITNRPRQILEALSDIS